MKSTLVLRYGLLAWVLSIVSCASHDGASGELGDPLRQATASVMLSALGDSGVTGTATFVATASGVDLTLRMRGCAGEAAKPIVIVEARDCASLMTASEARDGMRGAGIPGVLDPEQQVCMPIWD